MEGVKLHLNQHRQTLEYVGCIFERLSTYPPRHKMVDTGRFYILKKRKKSSNCFKNAIRRIGRK